jgi:hypothetical protein
MSMPNTKVIVFNAAAVIVAVGAVAMVVRSWIFTPSAAPCSERYLTVTSFALERSGVLLVPADLQSGLGGKDAGVVENLGIARVEGAPAPLGMSVNLPKGSLRPHTSDGVKGGVSFPWRPRSIQGKTAACLSYGVLLPVAFEFGAGGTLPGIQGADASGRSDDAFAARVAWRDGGYGGASARTTSVGATTNTIADREGFQFPRGRWVKLEEEVVLNTPRQANGILRVWADGKLVVERTDMTYSTKPETTIAGAAVDVFYGTEDKNASVPKDAKIWLTPLELRW